MNRSLPSIVEIQSIHNLYCLLMKYQFKLEYDRERGWYEFLKAGFTEEDLALVIRHIQNGIIKGTRNPGALRFGNLVQRLDMFEEELAMTKAEMRNQRRETPRERALNVLRPKFEERANHVDAKHVSELIPRLIQEMRKSAQ